MGIRLRSIVCQSKQILKLQSLLTRSQVVDVPKGHCAVYVGDFEKKRFVVPVSTLNHPSFQDLLHHAEEEFGFDHPMGGITIPCKEATFLNLTSQLNASITMGIRLRSMIPQSKQIVRLQSFLTRNQLSTTSPVPKGHCAVYVGETEMKRFVVPVSYLNHPSFQILLSRAEEEFGFDHPMGALTIPCKEAAFLDLTSQVMGLRLPGKSLAKQILRRSPSAAMTLADVPKGHFAVYVGENQKRFVVPISILNHPSFQDLLSRAEEEFGFAHRKGGLTIPCDEDTFIHLTSNLNSS
ncbi:hypothetical protein MKW92_046947 [Papaver armeniacum]|nr:hypothetical protein MKW92_046947 [Papaver armeniacum]